MNRLRMNRIRLGDARSALRRLIEDPERTQMVFEIAEALAGIQPRRLLRRIRRSAGGARLLRERPVFDPATCDLDRLFALSPGTFGHEFARWMKESEFRPGRMERGSRTSDPDLACVGKRLTRVHDFIPAAITWRRVVENWRTRRRPWSPRVPYLWRALRAGRRARFLPPLVLEELFPLPLESARALLAIAAPASA